jgi:pimeloyl-ACP methyl ester carboxylesterase
VTNPRVDTTFSTPDGRRLGYAEYGEADGKPVFLFHGNPGSRYEWLRVAGSETLRRLRAIAPDRPGFGLSDFQPRRTHLDWAKDVAALADNLGLDKFAVIGFSAGGAHALACAAAMPERVARLGLISCVAPLDVPGITEGMSWPNKRELLLARASFVLAWAWMVPMARRAPGRARRRLAKAPDGVDRDKQDAIYRNLEEAFRQGARGCAYELTLRSRPWVFDVSQVSTETHLWQGEADDNVPPPMGHYLAKALPKCEAHFVPGGRHALHGRRMDEILSAVMKR